jgi:hypothetical protein
MSDERCLIHGNVLHYDRRSGFELCYQCEREQSEPAAPAQASGPIAMSEERLQQLEKRSMTHQKSWGANCLREACAEIRRLRSIQPNHDERMDKRIMEYENDEASVCPEDVGFVEFVGVLQSKNERLQGELAQVREALEIIRDGSDEFVSKRFRAYAREALDATASSSAWLLEHDANVKANWKDEQDRLFALLCQLRAALLTLGNAVHLGKYHAHPREDCNAPECVKAAKALLGTAESTVAWLAQHDREVAEKALRELRARAEGVITGEIQL